MAPPRHFRLLKSRALSKSRQPGGLRRRKWKSNGPMVCGCGSRTVIPHRRWSPCCKPSWTPADAATHPAESYLPGRAARRLPERHRWTRRPLPPHTARESVGRHGLCLSQPYRYDAETFGLRWSRLLAVHETALAGAVSLVADRYHTKCDSFRVG